MSTRIYDAPYLILGCGNTLFGNDGFGPMVAEHLQKEYALPESVLVLDAGTGIRDLVFDLLLIDPKPLMVIVVDAVTVAGKENGEIFEIDITRMPKEKISDFSLHQSPSSNLLSQLKDQGVDVRVLGMQTDTIPNEICPGLTDYAHAAIPLALEWIMTTLKARSAFNV